MRPRLGKNSFFGSSALTRNSMAKPRYLISSCLYCSGRPEAMRGLFVEYLDLANELAERPRFYRTILDNCTTVVWKLVDRLVPGLPIDYRVVLSGYLPAYLHERGALGTRYSLEDLTAMGLLPSDIAYDGTGPGFSAAIRAGLPAP